MALQEMKVPAGEVQNLRTSPDVDLEDGANHVFQVSEGGACVFIPKLTAEDAPVVGDRGYRILPGEWWGHTPEADETVYVYTETYDSAFVVDSN